MPTSPMTDADDMLNLYTDLLADYGPNFEGVEVKDRSFDAGLGLDTLYLDAGYSEYTSEGYFKLTADDKGVVTLTTSSGGVSVSNFEKIEFKDHKIVNLGTVGADTIVGGNNADPFLFGLGGKDNIKGLDGKDFIIGGSGKDTLTGGAGRDTFDYNALADSGKKVTTRDVIKDFKHLTDRIDLSTLDASTKKVEDQAFKFIKSAAFHKVAGEVNFVKHDAVGTANDFTLVRGDVNGDGVADFVIELSGLKSLTAIDFIL